MERGREGATLGTMVGRGASGRAVREGSSEEATSRLRPEGREGAEGSKGGSGRRHSRCKGPEAGLSWENWRGGGRSPAIASEGDSSLLSLR